MKPLRSSQKSGRALLVSFPTCSETMADGALDKRVARTKTRLELIGEGATTLARAATLTATKAASALAALESQVVAGTLTVGKLRRINDTVYDYVVFAGEPIDVVDYEDGDDEGEDDDDALVYSRLSEVGPL